jgi:hypothetical protein
MHVTPARLLVPHSSSKNWSESRVDHWKVNLVLRPGQYGVLVLPTPLRSFEGGST